MHCSRRGLLVHWVWYTQRVDSVLLRIDLPKLLWWRICKGNIQLLSPQPKALFLTVYESSAMNSRYKMYVTFCASWGLIEMILRREINKVGEKVLQQLYYSIQMLTQSNPELEINITLENLRLCMCVCVCMCARCVLWLLYIMALRISISGFSIVLYSQETREARHCSSVLMFARAKQSNSYWCLKIFLDQEIFHNTAHMYVKMFDIKN